MYITNIRDVNYIELYEFYVEYAMENTKYVIIDWVEFQEKIMNGNELIVYKEENIEGFICGNMQDKKGYITLCFGSNDIIKNLITQFERLLISKGVSSIWVHFFNKTLLEWNPLPNIVHPGFQGAILNGKMHTIYTELNYQENSIQDTYYLNLKDFENKYKTIKIPEIEISIYDKRKHKGLIEFTDKINAPSWKETILNNESKETPLPLLVALHKNHVIGFTGPMEKSQSGRGYFAGIGILEKYRGKKIGKILFFRLCEELRNMGSLYMTLFTGRNNKAKYIYMDAGFKVVESFMTLKKDL